jgi:hypothetical protein
LQVKVEAIQAESTSDSENEEGFFKTLDPYFTFQARVD